MLFWMVANGPLLISVVEEIAILNKIDCCRTVKEQHKFDVRAEAPPMCFWIQLCANIIQQNRAPSGAPKRRKMYKNCRAAPIFFTHMFLYSSFVMEVLFEAQTGLGQFSLNLQHTLYKLPQTQLSTAKSEDCSIACPIIPHQRSRCCTGFIWSYTFYLKRYAFQNMAGSRGRAS